MNALTIIIIVIFVFAILLILILLNRSRSSANLRHIPPSHHKEYTPYRDQKPEIEFVHHNQHSCDECSKLPQGCGAEGQVPQMVGGKLEWVDKCNCPLPPIPGIPQLIASAEYPNNGGNSLPIDSRQTWDFLDSAPPPLKDLINFPVSTGIDFNPVTGVFTAPSDGIYNVSFFGKWRNNAEGVTNSVPDPGASATYLLVNGTVRSYDEDLGTETHPNFNAPHGWLSFDAKNFTQNIDKMLNLSAGDQVKFQGYYNYIANLTGFPTFFQEARIDIFKMS